VGCLKHHFLTSIVVENYLFIKCLIVDMEKTKKTLKPERYKVWVSFQIDKEENELLKVIQKITGDSSRDVMLNRLVRKFLLENRQTIIDHKNKELEKLKADQPTTSEAEKSA